MKSLVAARKGCSLNRQLSLTFIVTSAIVAAVTATSSAEAAGFNVNSNVTFTPLASTYRTSTNTTGCPAGFSGKFTFTALLTNKSNSPAMPGITVQVQTLTNGNMLLDPQTNALLGGEGAVMQVPKTGQYADGLLSAGESVEVPFVLCLKTPQPFQFLVNVSGIVTKLVGQGPVLSVSPDARFAATLGTGVLDLVLGTSTSVVPTGDASPAVFSGDSRFLAYTVLRVGHGVLSSQDVYRYEIATRTTALVSVNRAGTDHENSNTFSLGPAISANGRFVAFSSDADDFTLTPVGCRFVGCVWVRDMQLGTTTLVSVNRAGTAAGNGNSGGASISADGRFVAFSSAASDLTPNDTNGKRDLFVRDMQNGTTIMVSVNRTGTDGGNGDSSSGVLTPNGRFVVFSSGATDLVATPDTNGAADIFVRDLQNGTTTLVSVNQAGTSTCNTGASGPVITPDGRFVGFLSNATDLVLPDTNGTQDVFVRDLQLGATKLASVNYSGTNSGNGISGENSGIGISPNGRFVVFSSVATDLVTIPDANQGNPGLGDGADIFARDLQMGTTSLVTINYAGTATGNAGSIGPFLSADGHIVVFVSNATDLTPNAPGSVGVFERPID